MQLKTVCHLNMQMKLWELEFSQKSSANFLSVVLKSNLEISDVHKLSELQVYISATKPVFKLREPCATPLLNRFMTFKIMAIFRSSIHVILDGTGKVDPQNTIRLLLPLFWIMEDYPFFFL